MLQRIPILKNLRYREQLAGKDVSLKDEVQSVPEDHRQSVPRPKVNTKSTRTDSNAVNTGHNYVRNERFKAKPVKYAANTVTSVYIGNIPQDIRVSDLKAALREHNALPLRLNWHGAQHRAFLDYKDQVTAEEMVSTLSGLCIGGKALRAELAKKQLSSTGERQSSESPKELSNKGVSEPDMYLE